MRAFSSGERHFRASRNATGAYPAYRPATEKALETGLFLLGLLLGFVVVSVRQLFPTRKRLVRVRRMTEHERPLVPRRGLRIER